MRNISDELKKALNSRPVKDQEKLQKQQKYYKRLSSTGVAQKQSYNLKPLSAI